MTLNMLFRNITRLLNVYFHLYSVNFSAAQHCERGHSGGFESEGKTEHNFGL